MQITNKGQSIWNPITGGFGIAVAGSDGSGSVTQYNNGHADTYNVGSVSKNGSIHSVICTDGQAGLDTITLGQGWTKSGDDVVDDATGIHGTLYTSATGDQLLINGGAKVVTPSAPIARTSNPNGTLNDEAVATQTLTTGGNFEKVAGSDNQISLQEAKDACAKTPEDTDANKALKKALTWLTTGGHYEMISGGSDKTISLQQLQNAFLVSSGIEG